MNRNLDLLQPYPFEKLTALKAGIDAPAQKSHIPLFIGEPKHPPPAFVLQALVENLAKLANYPITRGIDELRETIARWAEQRFSLTPGSLTGARHVLPVAGTREALFAFVQACVPADANARVLMPNPFYQIYEGAALLAGARPHFINCSVENNYKPDFDAVTEEVWRACRVLFICTPGNPTGTVFSLAELRQLIELADRYDFILASDECYSELYFDEQHKPPGLLEACAQMGRDDFERCVVFHSLSKRSNLPGLRSGFVAGDAQILARFLQYRTYQGCALPLPTQLASAAAWSDETHVRENRSLYQAKFEAVFAELGTELDLQMPDAGFYFWAKTPIDDREFTRRLFAEQNVTVLPGRFLAREVQGVNPGANHVRMALVASVEECVDAAQRIREFLQTL